jgi:hypothetical protein
MFKGKCLYTKNWIKSNILYVRDIIDQSGKIIDEKELLDRLTVKVNWIAEYHMVQKACKIIEVKDLSDLCNTVNIRKGIYQLYIKDKHYDIENKRSNFYYDALRNVKFVHPYMQNVWYKELKLDSLKYQRNWQLIYKIRIKKMPIKKIAEFNYKLLTGILPCGMLLSKWKKNIGSQCSVCLESETLKHMLYECRKVNHIWNKFGRLFTVHIRWKHIVIGYYLHLNENTKAINLLTSFIAYSIFKINNRCKWEETDYGTKDVKSVVINDLILLRKTQEYCTNELVKVKYIDNLVKCLEDV